MEMRPTLKRQTTISEKLKGKKDEYKQIPQIVGMSGTDPVGEFVVEGIGLERAINGLIRLGKVAYNAYKVTGTKLGKTYQVVVLRKDLIIMIFLLRNILIMIKLEIGYRCS